MTTLVLEQDEKTLEALNKIFNILQELTEELKKSNAPKNSSEEWLNASAFCRKYGISRPTLKKRVTNGVIEACDFGGDILRYRWRE